MTLRPPTPLIVVFVAVASIGATDAIRIIPNAAVPLQYQQSVLDTANSESEPTRYKKGYEAFWWNCVFVRADDLSARCPIACSGTPAATDGCANGAIHADVAIDRALKQHGATEMTRYLSRSSNGVARERS